MTYPYKVPSMRYQNEREREHGMVGGRGPQFGRNAGGGGRFTVNGRSGGMPLREGGNSNSNSDGGGPNGGIRGDCHPCNGNHPRRFTSESGASSNRNAPYTRGGGAMFDEAAGRGGARGQYEYDHPPPGRGRGMSRFFDGPPGGRHARGPEPPRSAARGVLYEHGDGRGPPLGQRGFYDGPPSRPPYDFFAQRGRGRGGFVGGPLPGGSARSQPAHGHGHGHGHWQPHPDRDRDRDRSCGPHHYPHTDHYSASANAVKRGPPLSSADANNDAAHSSLPSHSVAPHSAHQDKKRSRMDSFDYHTSKRAEEFHATRFQNPSSSSSSSAPRNEDLQFQGPSAGTPHAPLNPNNTRSALSSIGVPGAGGGGGDRRGGPDPVLPSRRNNFIPQNASVGSEGASGGPGRTYWNAKNNNNNSKHFDDFRGSQSPYDAGFRAANNSAGIANAGAGTGGGPLPPYGDAETPYASRGHADNAGSGPPPARSIPATHVPHQDQFGRQIPNLHRSKSTLAVAGGDTADTLNNQPFSRPEQRQQLNASQDNALKSTFHRPHADERDRNHGRHIPPNFDRHSDASGTANATRIHSNSKEPESAKSSGTITQQSRLKDTSINNVQKEGENAKSENEHSQEKDKEKIHATELPKEVSKHVKYDQNQHRPQTPPPQIPPEEAVVNVVPLSPPSPPAAPPSGLALAMSKLTDLTAQMEFQYAKHLQLEREHEIVKAKLMVLQNLPVGTDAFREDLKKLTLEKEKEEKEKKKEKAKDNMETFTYEG